MSESKQPCDLHAWQPVLLPDGRTAILCGKCGQHAVTLPVDPLANFLPPVPQPSGPIWVVPYWQWQYPPLYPSAPRVICTDHVTKIPVSGVVSGVTSITTAMTEPPYPSCRRGCRWASATRLPTR